MINGRQFHFFKAGAPYPGICLACSNVNNLWALGTVRGTNQVSYLCEDCLRDVATGAGYMLKTEYTNMVESLSEEKKTLTAQLDAVPALLRKVQENVSIILADFVTDLAAISSKPATPNIENPEASPSAPSSDERHEPKAGEGKKQSPNTSPKPSRK